MAKNTMPMTVIKPIQFDSAAFSRSSPATLYNSTGILETAGNDVLRNGYNPTTLEYIGNIIEAESTNNFTWSNDFHHGEWTASGGSNVTDGAVVNPDGSTGAKGISSRNLTRDLGGAAVASIFVKLASDSSGNSIFFGGDSIYQSFGFRINLQTGAITDVRGSFYSAQKLPNGWWRLSVGNEGALINNLDIVTQKTGYPFAKVWLWGAQSENIPLSSYPTSFIYTTSTPETRAADIVGSPPMVTSTNIPGGDHDEWTNVDTYSIDEYVTVSPIHRNYRAKSSVAADKYPPDFPDLWLDAGATNAWRMFDMSSGADNQSTNPELIQTTVFPGSIADAVVLLNCYGNYARVTVKDGETVIYQKQKTLRTRPSSPSWYAWYFGERQRVKDLVFLDLPAKRNVTITIEIVSPAGIDAKIGKAIFGRKHRIGFSEYGSSAGVQSYSTKNTDTFGNTTIVKRRFVGKMDLRVVIDRDKEDFVHRKFSELLDIPAVYIGHEDYKCLLVFGFFNDFTVLFSSAGSSYCNTTITGI